jgi:hypothetical protein
MTAMGGAGGGAEPCTLMRRFGGDAAIIGRELGVETERVTVWASRPRPRR